jgi:hypothetical protein
MTVEDSRWVCYADCRLMLRPVHLLPVSTMQRKLYVRYRGEVLKLMRSRRIILTLAMKFARMMCVKQLNF